MGRRSARPFGIVCRRMGEARGLRRKRKDGRAEDALNRVRVRRMSCVL